MVETSARKANRGLLVEGDQYRICGSAKKTVMHWLSDDYVFYAAQCFTVFHFYW